MAYKKFDDATAKVSQSARKVGDAFWNDAIRRSLQGVLNRVINVGIAGTATTTFASAMGTGTTGGINIPVHYTAVINGRAGTISSQAMLNLPTGTQGISTYVKYLVSSGFGSSGTITAGNEGTGSTTALLPDCPANHVALGYMEFYTNAAAWPRGGKTRDFPGKASGTGGTGGTINAIVDLWNMPLKEDS
jgi:hypothetical protein